LTIAQLEQPVKAAPRVEDLDFSAFPSVDVAVVPVPVPVRHKAGDWVLDRIAHAAAVARG